jgi:hypothetical protein
MSLDESDELLLAIAAARLSVDLEASHPAVAAQAQRVSGDLRARHGVSPEEAVAAVLDD